MINVEFKMEPIEGVGLAESKEVYGRIVSILGKPSMFGEKKRLENKTSGNGIHLYNEFKTGNDSDGVIITIKLQKGFGNDITPFYLHIFVGNYLDEDLSVDAKMQTSEDIPSSDVIHMYNSLVGKDPFILIDSDLKVYCRFSKKVYQNNIFFYIYIYKPSHFVRCVQKKEYEYIKELKEKTKEQETSIPLARLCSVTQKSKKIYLTDEFDFNLISSPEEAVMRYALPAVPYGYVKFEIDAFEKMKFDTLAPRPGVVKEYFGMPGGGLEYLVTVTENDSVSVFDIEAFEFENVKSSLFTFEVEKYFDNQYNTVLIGDDPLKKGNSIEALRLNWINDSDKENRQGLASVDERFYAITDMKAYPDSHLYSYSNIVYCVADDTNKHSQTYNLYLLFADTIDKAIRLNETDRNMFLKDEKRKFATVKPKRKP